MEKIQAYIYEADYILNEENKAVIRLFGRTPEGKKICATDEHFEPYFYVYAETDHERIQQELLDLQADDAQITKTELETKTYKGTIITLIKAYTTTPSAIPKLRDRVYEIEGVQDRFEADILFARRYLLNKNLTPLELATIKGELYEDPHYNVDYLIKISDINTETGTPFEKPSIIAIDIETYTLPGRYSNPKRDPILTIALYGETFHKVLSWKRFNTEDETYEFVQSEAELITRFIDIIKEQKPDYLTGYFTDGFDFPFLRDRAKKHNLKLSLGIDGSMPKYSKGSTREVHIAGIPHLDLNGFIRYVMKDSLKTDSYSLDNVAEEIIGETKLDIEQEKIGLAWDAGAVQEICEYNLQDAKITHKLCNAILPNIAEIARLTGQSIHDIVRMSTGQIAEWYLIKSASEDNQLIPNKPEYGEAATRRMQTYQGAYVFDTTPGVYENLAVFDFRSLYPSIIIAHNIDPASLTHETEGTHETPLIQEEENETHYYFTKEEAFIPRILKDLIDRRARIKELLKKQDDKILIARSYGLKLITNSAYGLFGFFGARWYSRECAAAITAWGRDYVQKTAAKAEREGYTVVGGDTDSIMLKLNNHTREEALHFIEHINQELPEAMELELEDFYPRGIFVSVKGGTEGAKKKYAFINDQKKLKIRGFEAIRRDWSLLARNTQREVLRIILEENNPEKAITYVKKVIADLRNNKFPLTDLIIKTQIRKDISSYENVGPHVRVAERMKQLGMPIGVGTMIEYIITEGKGPLRDRAKLPDECQDGEYDSEYYINNQILPAVQSIVELFGHTKEDIIRDKKQRSLADFT